MNDYDYDETYSQLRRRLPLGAQVRHRSGWEGTVVGYEYGQVEVKVADGGSIPDSSHSACFCYGRNLTACDPS